MKARVTKNGLLIPRELLEGVEEVEIVRRPNMLLVVPVTGEDPILQLGQEPVLDDVTDSSINHDRYLYCR
jgi:hypothetical protein